MKRTAEKENDLERPAVKKARHNLVDVLSEQNQQQEKDKLKLGRDIKKVLSSLNADVSRNFGEDLYSYLPGNQRRRGPHVAGFCFFLQKRQQIFVEKSSNETKLPVERLFQDKFFTNIYGEADTGSKYIRRKILARYDVRHLKTEEVQDIVFMTASYR